MSAAGAQAPRASTGAHPGEDFLAAMVAGARARVAAARSRTPLGPPSRPGEPGRLRAALARPVWPSWSGATGGAPTLALIAEIKRRSPSKGDLAPGLDAVAQARAYAAAGADAVSVLTEPERFGGSLDDLRAVAAAVDLPVLRKDFIIDPYQIREAADAGAAAVLLIAVALPADGLRLLLDECRDCGLDALVEVHDCDDLRSAEAAGATLIGVNNRDLRTLAVDLRTTERLVPAMAGHALPVSESGIAGPAEARRAATAGARAVLVGETLVGATTAELPALVAALKRPGMQR